MKMEKGDRKTKRHGKLLYRFNLNFLYEVKSSELLFVFVVVVVVVVVVFFVLFLHYIYNI